MTDSLSSLSNHDRDPSISPSPGTPRDPTRWFVPRSPASLQKLVGPGSNGSATEEESDADGYADYLESNRSTPISEACRYSPSSSLYRSPSVPQTPHVVFASPEKTFFPGLIVPVVTPQRSSAQSPSSQSTPKGVENSGSDTISWTASRNIISPVRELPPFRNKVKEEWRASVSKNAPRQATQADVLRHLKPARLESVGYASEKHADSMPSREQRTRSRFESRFSDFGSASTFFADSISNPIEIDGGVLEVEWARAAPMKPEIKKAIEELGATRTLNVELDEIYNSDTVEEIKTMLSEKFGHFGIIQSICRNREREDVREHWAIRFTSVESAMSAKFHFDENDPSSSEICRLADAIRFNQTVDVPLHPLKKQAALLYLGESPYNWKSIFHYNARTLNHVYGQQSIAAILVSAIKGDIDNIGNRCVCISKLPSNATMQDVCNTVRGGMIERIKLLSDRNICFVTFLEATAAAQFWAFYQMRHLNINGESVRVGWGRHPGPLAPEIYKVVGRGVTRNSCIRADSKSDGAPASSDLFSEDYSYYTFRPFGAIEQVRVAHEVGCSFISFADIGSAVHAAEWARRMNHFPGHEVNYGKDRCAASARHLKDQSNSESNALASKSDPSAMAVSASNGKNGRRSISINYLRRELAQIGKPHSKSPHIPIPMVPLSANIMVPAYSMQDAAIDEASLDLGLLDAVSYAANSNEKLPMQDDMFGGPLSKQ